MNPVFVAVWEEEIGAYNGSPLPRYGTVMVPYGKSRILLLHNARGRYLNYDTGRLKVLRLGRNAHVYGPLQEYLTSTGLFGRTRQAVEGKLLARIMTALSTGSELLLVTGLSPGSAHLQVATANQGINVLTSVDYSVSFRFLQSRDKNGMLIPSTKRDPSEVDQWINSLNWIFGAQANIWFEAHNSTWFDVNQQLEQPITDKPFFTYIEPQKDPGAEVTIFLVGQWKSGKTGDVDGTFFNQKRVGVLDDSPQPIGASDSFMVTLAHELAHFVGESRGTIIDHHDRNGILLSNYTQTSRIDDALTQALNPV